MVIALGTLSDIIPNCSGADLEILDVNGNRVRCHFPRQGQLEYFRNAVELLFDALHARQKVQLIGRENRVRTVRFF